MPGHEPIAHEAGRLVVAVPFRRETRDRDTALMRPALTEAVRSAGNAADDFDNVVRVLIPQLIKILAQALPLAFVTTVIAPAGDDNAHKGGIQTAQPCAWQ